MKKTHATLCLPLCAFAMALASSQAAHATDDKVMTNAAPASAASGPTARRTLKFDTRHAVPGTLTLAKDTPVADGYKARLRFTGQTELKDCTINLPKVGQQVQPGESAIVTVRCATPWQVYDNGLGFEVFEDGRKVGEGTLRP